MTRFIESTIGKATLVWLKSTCWQVACRPDVAPSMPVATQTDCGPSLAGTMIIGQINKDIPEWH